MHSRKKGIILPKCLHGIITCVGCHSSLKYFYHSSHELKRLSHLWPLNFYFHSYWEERRFLKKFNGNSNTFLVSQFIWIQTNCTPFFNGFWYEWSIISFIYLHVKHRETVKGIRRLSRGLRERQLTVQVTSVTDQGVVWYDFQDIYRGRRYKMVWYILWELHIRSRGVVRTTPPPSLEYKYAPLKSTFCLKCDY